MIRAAIGFTLGALALFFIYWGVDVAVTIPDEASVATHLIAGAMLAGFGLLMAGGSITLLFFVFKRP
ncbi:MAG TPA: hypothetical protein VI759_03425 [Dehalococcoidia bacterium]|nr:hypothetical protein [Dehalococcoidia bacterium]